MSGNEEREASLPPGQQIEFELALLSAFGGIVKWLMASLLLLNGGAMIALIQHDQASILIAASGRYFVQGAIMPVFGALMAAIFVATNIDLRKVFPEANKGVPDQSKAWARNRVLGVIAAFIAASCMFGSISVFTAGARAAGEALSHLPQTEAPPASQR